MDNKFSLKNFTNNKLKILDHKFLDRKSGLVVKATI